MTLFGLGEKIRRHELGPEVGDDDDLLVEHIFEPEEVFSDVEGSLGLGMAVLHHGDRRLIVLIHDVAVDGLYRPRVHSMMHPRMQ